MSDLALAAYEDGVGDCVFAASMADGLDYQLHAWYLRSWAWRNARVGIDYQRAARDAAIYDEMADAKGRNDHAAIMAGFKRLQEIK